MLKKALKELARSTAALVLPRRGGVSGKLAVEGGRPVRDTRLRPWPGPGDRGALAWMRQVGPRLRSIYLDEVEGLPQPLAETFNAAWATYCGTRYALLLAHGTDALRIGLAAALDQDGLEYGGEVIVPNFSFIASATAPLDRRFGIALVDVDADTLLLDPRRVEEAIVPGKTRAILPVHLFGQPADMTSLRAIAERNGLKLIEDAAQAHGAEWESGPVGSLGDAGAFSFQSSKVLNCGEGGALVTGDEALFERAYGMQNVGRDRHRPGRWEHLTLGWNGRPTEYQAALLLHRLASLDRLQNRRRENFDLLRRRLDGISCVEPLGVHAGVRRHGMYMFAMRYRPEECGGLEVDDFIRIVQAEGIPLYRAFHATISAQPAIRTLLDRHPSYLRAEDTPVADRAAREIVFLPHTLLLAGATEMDEVGAAFEKVMARYRESGRAPGASR